MQYETEPLTVQIERSYKADLAFKTLPLDSFDLILGSPWLMDNRCVTDHASKSVTFPHQGKMVVLHPLNPRQPLTVDDLPLTSLPSRGPPPGPPKTVSSVCRVRVNPSSGPARPWPFTISQLKHLPVPSDETRPSDSRLRSLPSLIFLVPPFVSVLSKRTPLRLVT